MYWDMVQMFFGESSLETSLHVMILCVQHRHRDAVTYTCSNALRHPVSFCFTETGMVPFESLPDLIVPYDFMSKPQLTLVLGMCKYIEEVDMYKCSSKMGQGFFIRNISDDKHFISPTQMVGTLHRLLSRLCVDGATRCVIMHRVMGDCAWNPSAEGAACAAAVGPRTPGARDPGDSTTRTISEQASRVNDGPVCRPPPATASPAANH